MTALFLQIVNMSLAAGWVVLAVIVLRLVLKKAPKAMVCLLWGLVALRLLCPFSIESVFSLIPDMTPITSSSAPVTPSQNANGEGTVPTPSIDGSEGAMNAIPPTASLSGASGAATEAASAWGFWDAAAMVWLVGVGGMLTYSAVSVWRLRRRVCASVRRRDNLYICDDIDTPFILGVLRPRIYVPSALSPTQMDCVVAHEQAHLQRRDHWIKPFGFALLAVYWFHPLIWVAYILLCRDVEMACDERVIQKMDTTQKAQYSETLLMCSLPRRAVTACPLAFGEVGVKSRIRSVLSYKNRRCGSFWRRSRRSL